MINALMARHSMIDDWCHLCGKRSATTADIWYAENAENDTKVGAKSATANGNYIRICADCGDRIGRIARGLEKNDSRL